MCCQTPWSFLLFFSVILLGTDHYIYHIDLLFCHLQGRIGEQSDNITIYTTASIFTIIPHAYVLQMCDKRIKASPAFKSRSKHHKGPASTRLCHHHALPRGKGRLRSWLAKSLTADFFNEPGSMQGAWSKVLYQNKPTKAAKCI